MAKRKYVKKAKPAGIVHSVKPSAAVANPQITLLEEVSLKMQQVSKRTLNGALLAAQKAFDHEDKDFFRACRNAFLAEDIFFRRTDFDVLDGKLHSTFQLTLGEENSMDCVSVDVDGDIAAALQRSLETWLRDFFLAAGNRTVVTSIGIKGATTY